MNNLLDDPVVHSYVISAQIATALADARNRVNFLAEHDSRTGLLNRDGFLRHAAALVAAGGGLGILIVDIVHFRSINELYGEPIGDAVLTDDRRTDRQDPLARPHHRALRRRRVRAGGAGIEISPRWRRSATG